MISEIRVEFKPTNYLQSHTLTVMRTAEVKVGENFQKRV